MPTPRNISALVAAIAFTMAGTLCLCNAGGVGSAYADPGASPHDHHAHHSDHADTGTTASDATAAASDAKAAASAACIHVDCSDCADAAPTRVKERAADSQGPPDADGDIAAAQRPSTLPLAAGRSDPPWLGFYAGGLAATPIDRFDIQIE